MHCLKLVVVLPLLLVLLPACTKELKLPDIDKKGKIVLLGELISGDTAYLRVGESVPLVSGSSMQFQLPHQVSVTLEPVLTGISYPLKVEQDGWSGILNTLAVSGNQVMSPYARYRIHAKDAKLGNADCEVYMPAPFSAAVLDTIAVNLGGTVALRTRIRINDNGSEENHYVVEAVKQAMSVEAFFNYNGDLVSIFEYRFQYDSLRLAGVEVPLTYDTTYFNDKTRMVVYTDDPNSENAKLGSTLSPNKRILLSDKSFNGSSYITQVFIDKSLFTASSTGSKGRVLLWIKSVPAEYFEFLRTYESFESVTGWGSLAQPRKLEGNIKGGLGMVGSAARIEYAYLYDRWTF